MRRRFAAPTILTLTLIALSAALSCGAGGGAQNASAPSPTATPTPTPVAAAAPPQTRTCALITDEEMKEVQGEVPLSGQGSEHSAESLSMSQCFYRLPTFGKSVSLEVVSAAADSPPGALKEYWRRRFRPDAVEAREQRRRLEEEARLRLEEEQKREQAAGQVREGGRRKKNRAEELWRPERVAGVGEEAFWSGNQKMWTLAVLSRERVVRVTLASGPEAQAENLKTATALARKVLKRL